MANENVQIEQYEVAVSSLALKQLGFQIDPVTPAESTATYKAQSGAELTLISEEKVIELIDAGLLSASGVYVIATDEASFRALLGGLQVINIWYTGPAFASTVDIAVVSSKNIYGADNKSFAMDVGFALSYPTSGATNDIKIHFHNGINNKPGTQLYTLGGYSGNGGFEYALRATEINYDIGGSSFITTEYEISNFDTDVPAPAVLNMWSGQNVQGKSKDETFSKRSPKVLAVITKQDNDVKDIATTSTEFNNTTVDTSIDGGTTWIQKLKTFLIEIGPSFNVMWGMDIAGNTALRVIEDNVFTKMIMSMGTTAYSWLNTFAFDVGPSGWSAYTSGDNSGSSQNAYLDNTTWRAKSTDYCALIEFEKDTGDIVEYSTATSITANSPCNFVERKRTDKNGNIAYNGASIPTTLAAGYKYKFWGTTSERVSDSNGYRQIGYGCYWDGSTYRSMISTSHYPSIESITTSTSLTSTSWKMKESDIAGASIGLDLGNAGTWGTVTPS
jgi:hypothetical protein